MAMRPPKHRPPRAVAPPKRPSATARGYGASWRRLRKLVLGRDPICRLCERALSTCVDHRVSLAAGGDNSMTNLFGLCKRCHDRKTCAVDGGLGRPRRPVP